MNEYLKLLFKINVHPTLWIVMGISILTAHFTSVIMLFMIVFIHELGHGIAAAHFDWRIKSIKLLPFGGVLETEEHGNKTLKEDLIVTLSGPIQHLWLAGASFLLYQASFLSYETYQQFFYMNLSLMVFNLLPVWPLDGGKLLFMGVSLYRSFLEAHRFTLIFSAAFSALSVLLVTLIQPFSLNVLIIAAFLVFSLVVEWKQRYYAFIRFLLERYYGRGGKPDMLKPIIVDENEAIYKVLEKFQRGCKHPIIITKNGRESGSLDENEILHAYFTDKMTNVKIGELLYSY
ncbi:stage IV sporulation protein FB [Bacillus sp. OV322]|uniref:M50 family metallopeptidase n=1 Tax=Bacillus sp. OV322 TaxID=1882764 RepID=UPI0008E5AEAC|nr:M50 family metallopeptidase [Bacillus sp. OV322]SFC54237.1 stage IV sporulation protein FB [Bacillus sp. OV322]